MMYRVWLMLVLIRLVWVMYPQQGYIHPDEFFQTVEIVAGDVYQVKHERTWEFRERVRSIVSPYLIAGIPMYAHRVMSGIFPSLQSAYIVLILPRLVMFLTSLVVDWTVYIMAKNFDMDRNMALILSSTSYATLVYNVRTFTNSLETFYFSVLLILFIKLIKIQDAKSKPIDLLALLNYEDEQFHDISDGEQEERNKTKLSPKKTRAQSSKLNENIEPFQTSSMSENCPTMSSKLNENIEPFQTSLMSENCPTMSPNRRCSRISVKEVMFITCLGVVCVSGFFSRPAFLMYACMPLAAWSCSFENLPDSQKRKLGFVLFIALSSTTIFFVCIDTFYFNWEVFNECLGNKLGYVQCIYLQLYFELMVSISPYHFVEYNRHSDNLSLHGFHQRFFHLLVNLPLLFGPAVIFLLLSVVHLVKYLYNQGTAQWLSGDRTHQKEHFCVLFVTFFIVPVCSLSFIPHQEPRFLIPVLPLVIIISVHYLSKMSNIMKNMFFVIWITFNIILSIFYGIFHQGGVIPSLIFIQQNVQQGSSRQEPSTNQNIQYNLTLNDKFIFFHTYMPPRHLLLADPSHDPILDLKGSSIPKLEEEIYTLLAPKHELSPERNVYVLCPGTLIKDFNFKFRYINSFSYHLTLEDPPLIGDLFTKGQTLSSLANLKHELSLHLIQVSSDES